MRTVADQILLDLMMTEETVHDVNAAIQTAMDQATKTLNQKDLSRIVLIFRDASRLCVYPKQDSNDAALLTPYRHI